MDNLLRIFSESVDIKRKIIDSGCYSVLSEIGESIISAIESGNKVMFCGNGGSAADAQHLAAELLVRLRPNVNRSGIPAIALATDTSTITACGNDFSFDDVYARMVLSLGNPGDALLVISTSGKSKNIIEAIQAARKKNIKVFGFLGGSGGKAIEYCEKAFLVPSDITGRIQESHITAGHALMEYIEDGLLNSGYLKLT